MIETGLLYLSLIGHAAIPGNMPDHFGHRIGGISSLRWDEPREELVALPDRGPGDGTVPYTPRFFIFSVREKNGLQIKLKKTVLFRDKNGEPFSGLIKTTNTRLDAEGLAVAQDGSLYVSEEYAPAIYHFHRDGSWLRAFEPPAHFIPKEGQGRVKNRGFEGLCLTPSGRRLVTLLQNPLAQDGGKMGKETRLLVFDLKRPKKAPLEYRVPMPDADKMPRELGLKQSDLAFNEIEALSETEFLLLERDNRGRGAKPGASANPAYKRVARIQLLKDGKVRRLPAFDLLAALADSGFDASILPVKYESLAWGRPVRGRSSIWVAVDNDFKEELPTYFLRFVLK